MILAAFLILLMIPLTIGLGIVGIARYRFQKNKKLLVFVKLLPLYGLNLKIAYKSEKDTSWRAKKFTLAAVLTANGTGLDILKDLFTGYYGVYRREEIQILNMGYRSKWQKFKDNVVGLKYPVVSTTMLQLLDSMEGGPVKAEVPDNFEQDEKLIEKLALLKQVLEQNTKEA